MYRKTTICYTVPIYGNIQHFGIKWNNPNGIELNEPGKGHGTGAGRILLSSCICDIAHSLIIN